VVTRALGKVINEIPRPRACAHLSRTTGVIPAPPLAMSSLLASPSSNIGHGFHYMILNIV